MFRGSSKVTLDAKGRLAIPSRFRSLILSRGDGLLVATVDRAHCLLIYPHNEWEKIERKLVQLPNLGKKGKAARKLQRLFLGSARELEMDNQGRILLPRELREFAGLEQKAMLVGQGHKFELWEEQRWIESREGWLAEDDGDFEDLSEELSI